jgi:uncharacterized protein (DUF302 family)
MQIDYTVPTEKSFAEALQAVVDATAERNFRVLAVHDVQATLAEKGFDREPLAIVEVCNSKHAHRVLAADVRIALMLPCPITVQQVSGAVSISTMRPTLIATFFPDAGVEDTAEEVERVLFDLVDHAAA